MKLRIGILGPGAIGSFLAAMFCKYGYNVVCIGRKDSVSVIEENGIQIESPVFGNFVACPKADVKLTTPVDVLFITVKSPFLKNALESIDPEQVKNAIVIPLLNGVGHREIIRTKLGNRVAVGMIGSIEIVKSKNGAVFQLSRQDTHIDLASDSDVPKTSLEKIEEAILKTGISVSILKTESEVIWKKLVRLSAIASMTAAFQKNIGFIRSDPQLRKFLMGMIKEGVLVARHEGVDLDTEEIMKQIDLLPDTLTTSLQRDIQAGLPSEVESITGGVLYLAKSYGTPTIAHQRAYNLIRKFSCEF